MLFLSNGIESSPQRGTGREAGRSCRDFLSVARCHASHTRDGKFLYIENSFHRKVGTSPFKEVMLT